MKKLTIQPGCISCTTCQFTAPQVFEVTDVSRVKPDADLEKHAELIRLAVERCPVQVIKFQEK